MKDYIHGIAVNRSKDIIPCSTPHKMKGKPHMMGLSTNFALLVVTMEDLWAIHNVELWSRIVCHQKCKDQ